MIVPKPVHAENLCASPKVFDAIIRIHMDTANFIKPNTTETNMDNDIDNSSISSLNVKNNRIVKSSEATDKYNVGT